MYENETLQASEKVIAKTKQTFRNQVWNHFQKTKICSFPSPFGRIPNFKGAYEAASQLATLEEFKLAASVEVNPDKPLESSRLLVLETNKNLYVPVPRLQENLLKKLIPQDGLSNKKIVSRWGIEHTGIKIDLYNKIHIDIIVVGSVAVSKEGYRIGKGKGYADLEFAILKEINAIDDNILIVTTVHDSQVFDELPKELFQKYDVPVDYILTPTKIIKVEKVLPKPAGVYWDLLPPNYLHQIEILKKLKIRYEREGKLLPNLADPSFKTCLYRDYRKGSRTNKTDLSEIKSETRPSTPNQPRSESEINSIGNTYVNTNITRLICSTENVSPSSRRKHSTGFSFIIGNIERNVRVKDLKKALNEKNIKPDSITWKGYRGFCYLHYSTRINKKNQEKRQPFSIDNVIEILQELKITPDSKQNLTVKVMEPITRIETTDVTTV